MILALIRGALCGLSLIAQVTWYISSGHRAWELVIPRGPYVKPEEDRYTAQQEGE